jgi:hypothetical protein
VFDGLWPLAMVMLAAAALMPASADVERVRTGLGMLAGPALGAIAALAILALDAVRPLGTLAIALAIAALAAVSVRMGVTFAENQRMMEGLRLQATTDPLTGLPHNREFHVRLSAEVDRARRNGRALSLTVIDLDHFKRVNDEHGHPAGDRALVEWRTSFAGTLDRATRWAGSAARSSPGSSWRVATGRRGERWSGRGCRWSTCP